MKYPEDWKIWSWVLESMTLPRPCVRFGPLYPRLGAHPVYSPDIMIFIKTFQDFGKNLREYLESLDQRFGPEEEVKIAGLPAIRREVLLPSGPGDSELATYLKKENLIFEFIFSPADLHTITEEDLKLNDQILSTFKFTEKDEEKTN